MNRFRLWLLGIFGKLDDPHQIDYFVIMVLMIMALFFCVTFYLFVFL